MPQTYDTSVGKAVSEVNEMKRKRTNEDKKFDQDEFIDVEISLRDYPFKSKKSIYQLVNRGLLPAYRVGRRLLFKRSEVEAFLTMPPNGHHLGTGHGSVSFFDVI